MSAVIDFQKYESYDSYFSALSNNVVRDYSISEKKRYIFATFIMRLNQSIREGHYGE